MEKYDFSGWCTRTNLKCSDGRTILKDAFKHNDGQVVPLVWNHQHNDPLNVLGHALLENREEGVYSYCTFNDTESGQAAKELVKHGDVTSLSIYANQLKQQGGNVLHGAIREVSLVLAGANPGAYIDSILSHGEESDEEALIFTGEDITLSHSEEEAAPAEEEVIEHAEQENKGETNMDNNKEKTVQDVWDTLNEEQKTVVYAMIGQALEDAENNQGDDENMKHNVFENDNQTNTLSHADMATIIADAKRYGSLKESFLAHAEEMGDDTYVPATYGIDHIDYLFPDAKNITAHPEFIKRDTGWVSKVMHGVHHTPFSRIKSMFADLREEDARAKGYIKGNLKKEEVFSLLKRTTSPTTIYKKQKLDRDDIVDITDFDVIAWLKGEMRMMLDEEIARAVLIGDGRLADSDDKINEGNIRPIWTDADLYTVKAAVNVAKDADEAAKASAFIKAAIRSRKNYKGSGEPTLYTTEDVITECLLLEDKNGRVIYDTVEKLRNTLRVKEIVTVPVMEGATRKDGNGKDLALMGLIVNLKDYNVGADKGGSVNMFDDFDIDYNQQKYLIETRCSGALIKPFSAVALELHVAE
jgi:HK97 family phage prohead protease